MSKDKAINFLTTLEQAACTLQNRTFDYADTITPEALLGLLEDRKALIEALEQIKEIGMKEHADLLPTLTAASAIEKSWDRIADLEDR